MESIVNLVLILAEVCMEKILNLHQLRPNEYDGYITERQLQVQYSSFHGVFCYHVSVEGSLLTQFG